MRPISRHELQMTPKKYKKKRGEKNPKQTTKQQKQGKWKQGLSVLTTDLLNSGLIFLSFRQFLWQQITAGIMFLIKRLHKYLPQWESQLGELIVEIILMIDYKTKYKLSKAKPYVKLLKHTISLSRDYICSGSRIYKHLHMLMFLQKIIQKIQKAKYRLHKQHELVIAYERFSLE